MSKKQKPVRLASTTGHVVIIGNGWTNVPAHMEPDAYASGCISEEMYEAIKSDINNGGACKERKESEMPSDVKAVINRMIDAPQDGYFTAVGLPNLKVLSNLCEFTVTKEMMLSAWEEVSKERDAADAEPL